MKMEQTVFQIMGT